MMKTAQVGPEHTARAVTARNRRATQRSLCLSQEASAPITFREVTRMPIGRDWLIKLIDILLDPLVSVVSLCMVALIVHGEIWTRHLLLAIVVYFPYFSRLFSPD